MPRLVGYFDASGSRTALRTIVVGGFVSKERAWAQFLPRWKKTLADAGESSMHLARFMANKPPYGRWYGREAEKAKLLEALAATLDRHTQKCFAEEVNLDDWHEVNRTHQLEESRCTPYALAAYMVVTHVMTWWQRQRHVHIDFVFEHGDADQTDFIGLIDSIISRAPQELRALRPRLATKSEAPELEAADFVAWAVRRARNVDLGDESLTLPSEIADSFLPLVRIEGKNRWGGLDVRRLREFCERYDVPKRGEQRSWRGLIERVEGSNG